MCAMVNCTTLIKYNIYSCNYASVWTILSTGIREIHQFILILNTIFSKQVRYRCIIHISIIVKPQSLIVPNMG